MTVYAGHIDIPDHGQNAIPANDRRYSNGELASVFDKTEAIANVMDELGYDTLWLAEHHFQHEGYECLPNILMLAVNLAHITKQLPIGCGFNIAPMWHPLRLAEDYATADILTKGRTVFGVGRGYHSREVETFGAPIIDQEANRELLEEQVEIVFKAFNNESFSHKSKHYAIPADVPYRGYQIKELTLVPRPVSLPVECWQPIVSASTRGIEFMLRHGIRGLVGGGAATMAEGPIQAYQRVANSMGHNFKLGEGLAIGVSFYLAKTREQAIREMLPYYEEHVKMFAPLGFVPGIRPAQVEAVARRGGWDAAGVPTLDHYLKLGSWFAGTPDDLVAHLKGFEERYPGMQHINLSPPLTTPRDKMVEQYRMVGELVMPHFRSRPVLRDARRLCPAVIAVQANHRLYTDYHERILTAVDTCLPVEKVCSIDEMACRLMGTERQVSAARELALKVKRALRDQVGECLTCSIGLAPNMFLGKVGSDLQKPDGLVVITHENLPDILLGLELQEIYGIGARMEQRLHRADILTVAQLWNATPFQLRRVWGGINGLLFHQMLHGVDIQPPSSRFSKSIGHQHVLEPELRTTKGAYDFAQHLLTKAAERLRRGDYYCRRLGVHLSWVADLGGWWDETDFHETRDTGFLLARLEELWKRVPRTKPLSVGVALLDLVPADQHQPDLFAADTDRRQKLSPLVDRINDRYGRCSIGFGLFPRDVRAFKGHAAFHRVPEKWEF